MAQNTHHIMMIRPVRFTFNEQTAESNSFQQANAQSEDTQTKALQEFDSFVDILRKNGVQVWVVDDTDEPHTPDSIFPNNWISMHEDSRIALYPMQAENRRLERRSDIAHHLAEVFAMQDIVDYTASETEELFLEGTGSMVLDRDKKICYACLSPRTHPSLLERFCADFGYRLISFTAIDKRGKLIYHTNVIMCVGKQFMVVCFDCIPNEAERRIIRSSTTKTIIEISFEQLEHFAGNMLEVINEKSEHLLVMSEQAYKSLTVSQIAQLEFFAKIVTAPLYTIEANGGGSARCMMAEIFLPVKK
ncbi:MAG: arginine deiminase-related protein [Bacteroidota bacterium]